MSNQTRKIALPLKERSGQDDLSGIKAAIAAIGGKWKILILIHLVGQKKRYGELHRLLPQISEKMLIQQLRELEKDGMLIRTAYPTVPPRVEYTLTAYAETICPIMQELGVWGLHHLEHRRALEGVI